MSGAAKANVAVDLVESEDIGERLLALVAEARAAGVDPEAALQVAARRYADVVRSAEAASRGVCPISGFAGTERGG
jgi:XTP/dITP diphosphohydrolase